MNEYESKKIDELKDIVTKGFFLVSESMGDLKADVAVLKDKEHLTSDKARMLARAEIDRIENNDTEKKKPFISSDVKKLIIQLGMIFAALATGFISGCC